jgi:hypothetical protein
MQIDEIMKKGKIDEANRPEILDIVNELFEMKVIEKIV